jgi:secretion/DNA translocation related TadE-like protein
MLCAVAIVLTVLSAVVTLAVGYHARHRAAAAADLAALAAAGKIQAGAPAACALARKVAEANAGVIRSCDIDGWRVVVAVAAPINGPAGWLPDPVRRARAGPMGGAGGGGLAVPVAGHYRVTARFGDVGPRWSSGQHSGLDFAAEPGTGVLAAAAGRIVTAAPAGRYGNLVVIDHGEMVTYYAHLAVVDVTPGEIVSTGQRVGAVGSTGNATGPHLHFEVRVDGVARDPAAYF